jgi:D-sedoheptulose 7-phosphate isomerase
MTTRVHAPHGAAATALWIRERFAARDAVSDGFFEEQALPLARACRRIFERFDRGGRLLAFGRGAYATDAAHVSVEFVHPVIVGKRALPAMDLSLAFEQWTRAVLRPQDIVIGFGPPAGDPHVDGALAQARAAGAFVVALPGSNADYGIAAPSGDPHVHQELVEILCHTLYESVHVFFEHREIGGDDVGASAFLYPFLGERRERSEETLTDDVAASILAKSRDARTLRGRVLDENAERLAGAIAAIADRVAAGGQLIAFGNGGSATDATDFALDCVMPEDGAPPIPAISLALEPAILTAVANDVGADVMFLRQLIAQGCRGDVAIAFSTSGGSRNVLAALDEARKRGMLTVALLGYDGGEIVRRGLADVAIVVRCDYIPRIQEAQATVYHVIREGIARDMRATAGDAA